MSLVVQKFGGTSVATPQRIKNVAQRVVRTRAQGHEVVVVVSAPGDTTDELIKMAYEIAPLPDEREMDVLLSTGEQISIALVAMAIKSLGCDAVSFTGPQVGIVTDNVHTRARILSVSSEKIRREQDKGKVVVVAGFQGVNIHEDITTLGRGGSDTTAIALAAALDADICEIYTDVEGVYTADPRIVPEARKLSSISYDAMLEYASLGAKVLNLRAVEFAKNYEVRIHVRSSFNKEGGTIVTGESEEMEKLVLNGVAYDKDEAKITIQGVPDQPGVASQTFQAVADAHINVDMIVQNVSVAGKTDLSFTVTRSDLTQVLGIVEKVAQGIGAKGVISDKDIAKVSIVGVGMRSHPGVAAKMFGALAECGINIQMISTSEIKISCIIEEKYVEKAVRAIHEKFELGSYLAPGDRIFKGKRQGKL